MKIVFFGGNEINWAESFEASSADVMKIFIQDFRQGSTDYCPVMYEQSLTRVILLWKSEWTSKEPSLRPKSLLKRRREQPLTVMSSYLKDFQSDIIEKDAKLLLVTNGQGGFSN